MNKIIVCCFLLGAVVGSFLNLVTIRFPLKKSVIFPPSHCQNCGNMLKPYDMIPIFSYLLLKGSCRYCASKISIQYPLVEILMGILFTLLFFHFGFTIDFVQAAAFTSMIIISAFIDINLGILPDFFNLLILIFGLFHNIWNKQIYASILGILLGFIIMGSIYFLSQGGMGAGDVKFTIALGAFLGPTKLLICIFVAFINGAAIGLLLVFFRKKGFKSTIPFGPFLAFGAFCGLIFDEGMFLVLNII